MTARITTLALAAALLAAMAAGAQRADAATYLGSPDPSANPDAYACAACPAGTSIGFRQFALRGATVEAPEDGVLVAAGVHAKRIAGAAHPRIAVLRPADGDGVGMTIVEPDVDEDQLGDETQDPDDGGLGLDWEGDWFEDLEEGDELDGDLVDDARPTAWRRLRLLDVDRRRGGDATLLLRVPRAGRLSAAITRPGDRLTRAGPFLTILTGDMRVKRAGRIRLRTSPATPGARLLARRPRIRTKAVISLLLRNGSLKVLMRSARLEVKENAQDNAQQATPSTY